LGVITWSVLGVSEMSFMLRLCACPDGDKEEKVRKPPRNAQANFSPAHKEKTRREDFSAN